MTVSDRKRPPVERIVERVLFASRWLLVPLYLGLGLLLIAFSIHLVRELIATALTAFTGRDVDLIVATLTLLDLTLVGGLVVMVMLSGYENFVSKLDIAEAEKSVAWLGKLDSGSLKIKVMVAIVTISAVQLLEGLHGHSGLRQRQAAVDGGGAPDLRGVGDRARRAGSAEPPSPQIEPIRPSDWRRKGLSNSNSMPILFLIVFIDLLGFGLVIPLLPFYGLHFGAGTTAVTWLLGVYSFAQLFSSPLLGRLSDRFGRKPILLLGPRLLGPLLSLARPRRSAVDAVRGALLRRRRRRHGGRGVRLCHRHDDARQARQGHGPDRRRIRPRLHPRAGARRPGQRQPADA